MKLFSYGSNMLSSRIGNRVKSHKILGVGYILRHSLRFHKIGQDTSGKADAFFTGSQDDLTWGVVGELDTSDKEILDEIEGLGNGYNLKTVEVKLNNNRIMEAQLYAADKEFINQDMKPFDWYKEFVYRGALENELPDSYIKSIEAIRHICDENAQRREENFRILGEAGANNDSNSLL